MINSTPSIPQKMKPQPIPLELISLEAIRIASPCRADWNKMRGDDQVRHCLSCAKNVYNLSAMTRESATRLIAEREGDLCIQLHRRVDGTVITSDCAVGTQSHKKSSGITPRFFALIAAAIGGVFGGKLVHASPNESANPTATVTRGERVMVTRGEPMMSQMGEAPMMAAPSLPQTQVMGKMRVSPPATPKKKKTVQKPGKNHGKRNSGNAKRNPKRGSKSKPNR